MKKRSRIVSLGVLALTLTMMSTSLVGATMARYVTEVTGSATAKVAAWSFKANNSGQDNKFAEIDLASTRTSYDGTDIKSGVIAPGTSGSFEIEIDGTGSEVGLDYSVSIAAADKKITLPSDLTFKVDGAAYTLGNNITGTINYSEAVNSMKKVITVSWEWEFGDADTIESNDNSYAKNNWTLDIAITGKQTMPTETVTP